MFLRSKSHIQSGRSLKPSLRICLNILILLLFLTGFLCGCLPSEPQLSVPDPAVTNAGDENPHPSGTPSSAGSDSQAAETPPETTAPPEPDIPAEPQEPDILTSPAADRSDSARLANLTEGSVQIVDERLPCDSGTVLIRRSYFMPSGDLVLSGSLQETDHSASSEHFAVPVFRIIREKACVHWYQSEKWFSAGSDPDSAESGTPPSGYYTANCLYLDTELEHLVIFLPKAYERLENCCVRYLPDRDGYLRISPTESGALEITLYAVCSGIRSFSDFYLACCKDPVLSWEKEDQKQAWSRCTGDIGGRFLHDGFYRTSPETYIPT
ncbi:MAG: hypothetical protein J6P31_05870 [Oscillospiraceae bacterium]|nr:hypothetical protein [Oscillospiraceae bacterium]